MENIYLNLAKARIEVQKQCNKKSGYNKYSNFDYFELKDFLSIATIELQKVGLVALFNIYENVTDGVVTEQPTLTITNGTDKIEFVSPSADAIVKGANGMQNLGSKHTYLKRYLYMNALELSENDSVDATIGKEKVEEKVDVKEPTCTPKQVEMIKSLYDEENQSKMINFYKVKSIEELTVKQASQAIANKKKEGK